MFLITASSPAFDPAGSVCNNFLGCFNRDTVFGTPGMVPPLMYKLGGDSDALTGTGPFRADSCALLAFNAGFNVFGITVGAVWQGRVRGDACTCPAHAAWAVARNHVWVPCFGKCVCMTHTA